MKRHDQNQEPDLRAAARYVTAHRQADDLAVYQIPYIRYTFSYYASGRNDPNDAAILGIDGLYTNNGMSEAEAQNRLLGFVVPFAIVFAAVIVIFILLNARKGASSFWAVPKKSRKSSGGKEENAGVAALPLGAPVEVSVVLEVSCRGNSAGTKPVLANHHREGQALF